MPYASYEHDEDEGSILGVVFAVIAVILLIGGAWFILSDSTDNPAPRTASVISIDTSNAALMHKYGMPTKSDVMEWHVHGQWGYSDGGTLHAFDELPGQAQAWDDYYRIPDNPAFDKHSK